MRRLILILFKSSDITAYGNINGAGGIEVIVSSDLCLEVHQEGSARATEWIRDGETGRDRG